MALYNSKTNIFIYLKEDGTIEINGDTTIDANLTVTGDVDIDGNATIGGTLSVTGNTSLSTVSCDSITINGLDFSSHIHGGVSTGGGTTTGPQ